MIQRFQVSYYSSPIKEKGHAVLNKLNRRAQHITGFRSNSSRYESEDILVSRIYRNAASG